MSAELNKKRPRTFQCRDALWQKFEQMARELECSVDYLINDAMKQYARQRGYTGTAQGAVADGPGSSPRAQVAPPPPPPAPAPGRSVTTTGSHSSVPPPGGSGPLPLPPPPPPLGGARGAPPPPPPAGQRPFFPPQPTGRTTSSPPAPSGAARRPTGTSAPLVPPPGALAPPPPPPPAAAGLAGHAPPPPPPVGRSMPPGRGAPPPPMPRSIPPAAGPAPRVSQAPGALGIYYQGERFPVNKDRFIIGRGKQSSDLTIKDPNVSRQHAMIEFVSGQYYIVDMGSTNGIEFNGQRVQRKVINEGDVFKVCDHELHFSFN